VVECVEWCGEDSGSSLVYSINVFFFLRFGKELLNNNGTFNIILIYFI